MRVGFLECDVLTQNYFIITSVSLKGTSYEAGSRMQAASGLHHLMGNHWHVLVSTSHTTPKCDMLN